MVLINDKLINNNNKNLRTLMQELLFGPEVVLLNYKGNLGLSRGSVMNHIYIEPSLGK